MIGGGGRGCPPYLKASGGLFQRRRRVARLVRGGPRLATATALLAVALDLALHVVPDQVDRVLGVLGDLLGAQLGALQVQYRLGRDGVPRDVLVSDLEFQHSKLGNLLSDLVEAPLGVLPDLIGDLKVASLDLDLHGTPLSGSAE